MFNKTFQTITQKFPEDLPARVADRPLLTQPELHQLLVDWNATRTDYPRDKCIHELFEEQVERAPDAVALVFEDQRLTYRELNRRANQLAHYLQRFGVESETLVGICMERSLEMVVGLVGILKAGGAYVPLDPAYPKERLAFMVEDTGITLVLAQQKMIPAIPTCSTKTLCLDTDWEAVAGEDDQTLPVLTTADTLAYVMYTSGSTGTPKGVEVLHRGVVRLVVNTNYARLDGKETFLQLAPISFDASTFELWAALLNGGTCIIYPPDVPRTNKLAEIICRHSVSTLWLTVSLFNAVIDEDPQTLKGISQLLIGGEKLSVPHVRRAQEALLGTQIINGYGPTENTTFTCCYFIPQDLPPDTTSIPIGRPISNTQVYILDEYLQPVPIGVPGELYTGGDGLARGYLNRPDLTAEKFIPDSFSTEPGARLYKTGDRARYLPDGNIEFLGRIDHQVKIRGFRIELGEIESILKQHEAVRDVVVMAREDVPGDKRLVAYIVPEKEKTPFVSVLRQYLKEKLPEYMIPNSFVTLDTFPLTPNGKVDRNALPAPEHTRPKLEETYVAPRTEIERTLVAIWQEVLHLKKVGIHDNFFEIGGYSLLAIQVISRINKAFQVDLPLPPFFENPTISGLSKTIEKVSNSGVVFQVPQIAPISRQARRPIFPLSFAQQRLWFMDQLEAESPLYNEPQAFRISGSLNVGALRQAFEAVVSRHEALRTTFPLVDEHPMQCITEKGSISVPVIDLTGLPETDRESEAQRLVAEEFRRPFDLARGPLLRVNLLCLGDSEHILLLTMHHIITDGWSIGILMQEIAALYEAFSQGTFPLLPDLPIQYADFAVWQREWLKGEALKDQTSYWKKQLGGNFPHMELPTDHPRPAAQTYQGKKKSLVLNNTLYEALKALSQREGVTLFMTLLAAFQTLLHRYTGQDDIIVGSANANRNRLEIEGLIGFFVNTLVLRTDLSGNPTFCDLLKRVRKVALGAYAYQELPFDKLVEELQVPRDLSYNPLFQVMFVLQNAPMEPLQLSDLSLSPLEIATDTAKFDLTLELIEEPVGLTTSIEYNTDLFDSDTIDRMAGHFQALLEGIIANPDARLSELPLLTQPERHQLLVAWNATQAEYPRDTCIHKLFEEQAERAPDATALVFEDQRLTYRELNRRANQLAHHLRKLGVGPEVLVGICMERSLEMAVGLLGILKTGGAYVPLDPAYPKERLAFMVEDTGIAVLLAQQKMIPAIPTCSTKTLCLDTDWEAVAGEDDQTLPVLTTADTLAYVMYTSGSTGTPKGVEVLHRGVVRLVVNTNYARLDGKETFLQLAPISFDASTFELWAALLNGGTCIIYPPDVPRTNKLAEIICRHSVSTLWLTVSLFNAVIDEDPQTLKGISQLLIGGEKLSVPHVRRAQEALLGTQIINGYGPTENTTFTCCYFIPQDLPPDTTSIPIGRPISNTQVYILDEYLQPVPIGVPGELYTGGDGLARGYLNRPDLTAEKFIPDSFSTEPGARLYKTGDRARYLPDGNIEFLGRIDHQVKIRGFRIELGEIESILGNHESVREVVVIAREDVPGDKRLVAYVVTEQEKNPSVSVLRQYLKEKLPEYMAPNTYVMLEKFPLTPNGKVDRKALPSPEYARPVLEETYVTPRTFVEKALASIWADVLGVERVGLNDNFFELGGYSLLAVKLFVRIRKWAGVDLPLATLFKLPTVRALAQFLESGSGDTVSDSSSQTEQWRCLVPIHPEGNRLPVFFIHAIGGNVFSYLPLVRCLGPDQPLYGLQARGLDGVLTPYASIKEMASHYISEIRSVQSCGPYFLGGMSFGGTVALEIAHQLTKQGEKVALLALFDSVGPGTQGYSHRTSSLGRRVSRTSQDYRIRQVPLPVYVCKRIGLYLSRRTGRYLSNKIVTLRCDLFRLVKRPVPLLLRDKYLVSTHMEALDHYIPESYHSPITLFRLPEGNEWPYDDPKLGWQEIAKGGLRTIIIDSSNHNFMDSQEFGVHFAEELRAAQHKVQESGQIVNGAQRTK